MHLNGLQAHKATGSRCYPTAVAGNSNDSNRIWTRLHCHRKSDFTPEQVKKKNNNTQNIRKTKTSMGVTFIPIIWTQSTAVPVALERNSARVSSAIVRRLTKEKVQNTVKPMRYIASLDHIDSKRM